MTPCPSWHQAQHTNLDGKQYNEEATGEGNLHKCLIVCCCLTHGVTFEKKCRDHSMIWDQCLLQSHISRHTNLYLGSSVDRLHILKHCYGNNHIRYSDQCNRPGLWQCHERYADKQVTPKPRHCSHGEMPYEKRNSFSKLPRQLRYDILDLRAVHHFCRVVFWDVLCRSQFGLK